MEWTDATTYSRFDKERKQTAWELKTSEIRIWISNDYLYYPGEWVYACQHLRVNAKSLKLPADATPEEAQARALAWVKVRLQKMITSLEQ